MKITSLRKQIVRNFSIAAVLSVILGSALYYNSHKKSSVQNEINAIESQTSQINAELSDLQNKTTEIAKYKDLWPKIDESRKNTSGIKIDETNSKLNIIAAKYAIASPVIKLSLPEVMKGGLFDRKTITVSMSTVSIAFTASSDVKAIMFVNEFISSLKGYPVVTSFSISKGKPYSSQDLVDMSTGKLLGGNVTGKVDFFWYVYKDLENKDDQLAKPKDSKTPALESDSPNSESEVPDASKQNP